MSEIISFLLDFYFIIVTILFSYMLWNTAQKSNQIAKNLENLEYSRDMQPIKINSVIIYYDINRITKIILSEHVNKLKNEEYVYDKANIKNILPNNNWYNNLVHLRGWMNDDEMDLLNYIYEKAVMLKELINLEREKEIKDIINEFTKKILLIHNKEYMFLFKDSTDYQKLFILRLRLIMIKLDLIKDVPFSRFEYKHKTLPFIGIDEEMIISGELDYDALEENICWNGKILYFNIKKGVLFCDEEIKGILIGTIKIKIPGLKNKSEVRENKKLEKWRRKLINKSKKNKLTSHIIKKTLDENLKATFKNGNLEKGKRVEFYDNGSVWYEIKYDYLKKDKIIIYEKGENDSLVITQIAGSFNYGKEIFNGFIEDKFLIDTKGDKWNIKNNG